METLIKYPQNWNHFIFQPLSPPSRPCSNPVHPWALSICFRGLVLDSKLLFTRHLHTVASKATGVFCNIFPLLSWDSVLSHSVLSHSLLSHSNKLTLYKLLIQSILTYTAPVWSSTCSSNYLRLQSYPVKMSLSHQ